MQIKERFNKYAPNYEQKSIIQQKGAALLVEHLPKELGKVIDLGCGGGRLFRLLEHNQLSFSHFMGVDFAKSMLQLHPKGNNITLLSSDFNSQATFEELKEFGANTLLSASALQWAKDIDSTFRNCAHIAPFGAFFLFSAGTFKTIHKIAQVKSPIYPYYKLERAFLAYYKASKVERLGFKFSFNSTHEMLRYIQQSGVSGDLRLSYRAIKRVLEEYPLDFLEFETALFVGESRCY